MLVVIEDKLINSIKNALAVRYVPHSCPLNTKMPISSPHTKNTGINKQVKNIENFNAFSISRLR